MRGSAVAKTPSAGSMQFSWNTAPGAPPGDQAAQQNLPQNYQHALQQFLSAIYEVCIATHAPAKVAMSCPAGAVLGASSVVDSRIPKAATAALRPCSGQQRTLADTSYTRGKEVMNAMQSSRRTRTRATKGRAAASKPATESRMCQSAPTTPCAVSER